MNLFNTNPRYLNVNSKRIVQKTDKNILDMFAAREWIIKQVRPKSGALECFDVVRECNRVNKDKGTRVSAVRKINEKCI